MVARLFACAQLRERFAVSSDTVAAMPTAFVTGANGFVGVTLVEQLVDAGWDVTAMHRPTSDISDLERFPVTRVIATLEDTAALGEAMPQGVDVVFHVAGDVSHWSGHRQRQTRTNVDGTRNVVNAALAGGAGRLVYTSSIASYGEVSGEVTEETPSTALGGGVNYGRTKWLAEVEVRKGIDRGLDAVIIQPGSIFGRYDRHSWGRLITMVSSGTLPGVPGVTIDFCHGGAVARAHITAAQSGATGEAYLVGGTRATFIEAAQLVAEQTGGKVPRKPTPMWQLRALGAASDLGSRVTKKEPDVTPELVRQLSYSAWADVTKAVDQLDYEVVPLPVMVEEAVDWMRSEGLIPASPS